MAETKTITTVAGELVRAGGRFGRAWHELKEVYAVRNKGRIRDKWFDNMVIKLDSSTLEGFHAVLRKMVREMYGEKDRQGEDLKWGLNETVLGLLGDRSRTYWRHAFMTGVFFGYYGYHGKQGGTDD